MNDDEKELKLQEIFAKFPQIALSDAKHKNHEDNQHWTDEAWEQFVASEVSKANQHSAVNFADKFDDLAVYTPALNTSYVGFVENNKPLSTSVPFSAKDFNFLDQNI